MSENLFTGRWATIIAFLAVVLFFGGFYLSELGRDIVWIFFFVAFGVLNIWNWRRVSRGRYLVSGIVFMLGGLTGLIKVAFSLNVSWQPIWLIAMVFFVLSRPIAALLEGMGILVRSTNIIEEKP